MPSAAYLLECLARMSGTQWAKIAGCLLGLYYLYLLTICRGE
jgi:hypothetical protein